MNVFEEKGITHLDLHGEKHEFVAEIVIDFIYTITVFVFLSFKLLFPFFSQCS